MKEETNVKMIVMAGPSGSGKTTLCKYLLKVFPELTFSVSATTRTQRNGETDGKDYYFLSRTDFENKIKNKQFLEYEEVYSGRFYGTLNDEILRIKNNGKIPILDVDVNGALRIKKSKLGSRAFYIFVHPVSSEILRERLINRGTEDLIAIDERLKRSDVEIKKANEFDHVLYNKDLEIAQLELVNIVKQYIFNNLNNDK